MKLYHYSPHQFEPGDIVEARVSFPYPDAWAWATTAFDAAGAFDGAHMFEVEPLTDDLEPSPHHKNAYRSRTGFKVIRQVKEL